MARKNHSKTGAVKAKSREDRLKAALKANLGRRKAQVRARSGETTAAVPTGTKNTGESEG